MSQVELIAAVIVFAAAAVMMLLAISHFMQKGFLFNNAYIYASKNERETMDKKPYYRQSAVVFSLVSTVFVIIGISLVWHNSKIALLEIPFIIIAVIYAIVSTVHIKSNK